jgi:hypothetical protein
MGVTAIETRVADVTVSVVEALMDPEVAVMTDEPAALLLARPVLLIAATLGAEELQLTEVVMFCVLPSANVPVALNSCDVPVVIEGFEGVRTIDLSCALWLPPTQPAIATRASPLATSNDTLFILLYIG